MSCLRCKYGSASLLFSTPAPCSRQIIMTTRSAHTVKVKAQGGWKNFKTPKNSYDDDTLRFKEYQARLDSFRNIPQHKWQSEAASRYDNTDSSFLFWLSDLQRDPSTSAEDKQFLGKLCAELVFIREWQDDQANRLLLPNLASSLAYNNYQAWKAENPGMLTPEPVNGLMVEQLYRLGEQEERRLQEGTSPWSRGLGYDGTSSNSSTAPNSGQDASRHSGSSLSSSRSSRMKSSIDSFAQRNKGYQELAEGAMAKARARLLGYDQGAAQVLDALLQQYMSREERANVLPEAFTPPGIQLVMADENTCISTNKDGEPTAVAAANPLRTNKNGFIVGGRSVAGATKQDSMSLSYAPVSQQAVAERACTTPQDLLKEIGSRKQVNNSADMGQSRKDVPDVPQKTVSQSPSSSTSSSNRPAIEIEGCLAEHQVINNDGLPRLHTTLPSGEDMLQVLAELEEDVQEYYDHVYVHLSPLERFGNR
ncbi:hypothetical protein CEUSTIGMA_g9329.t1 [Chlamydomonas eustigma]|uniref:Uncharacterized protein n=1 Tax=Chlamydomonas eustigma TaxID=1157962 RepID=A0A250XFP8_9CHLO|nr:hypothetical protein CEUSTIGMA_g9329.t1 [Chlamydomonas eustigma]|eukprot:GAX81901.1 hypothetical protein CEUSTIGMA_g9329.t1 [Chlamydomonas eustigma]